MVVEIKISKSITDEEFLERISIIEADGYKLSRLVYRSVSKILILFFQQK